MTLFYQGEAAAVIPRKTANFDWTQQWVWNMRFLLIMIAGNNYCLCQFPLNCDNRKFDAARMNCKNKFHVSLTPADLIHTEKYRVIRVSWTLSWTSLKQDVEQ